MVSPLDHFFLPRSYEQIINVVGAILSTRNVPIVSITNNLGLQFGEQVKFDNLHAIAHCTIENN